MGFLGLGSPDRVLERVFSVGWLGPCVSPSLTDLRAPNNFSVEANRSPKLTRRHFITISEKSLGTPTAFRCGETILCSSID